MPGEPQIEHFGHGGDQCRDRRQRHHKQVEQAVRIVDAGKAQRLVRREAGLQAEDGVEQYSQRGSDGLHVGAVARQPGRDDERAEHGAPQHEASGRIPFETAAVSGRAAKQRQIAEPPGRHGDTRKERRKKHPAEG